MKLLSPELKLLSAIWSWKPKVMPTITPLGKAKRKRIGERLSWSEYAHARRAVSRIKSLVLGTHLDGLARTCDYPVSSLDEFVGRLKADAYTIRFEGIQIGKRANLHWINGHLVEPPPEPPDPDTVVPRRWGRRPRVEMPDEVGEEDRE